MAPDIILYGYPQSPFAQKIRALLALRRLPYKEVTVARVPPRPELRAIGVTYRRIPVLVLDGVVYCDSYLIAQALEAAAPASDAHPSLFPPDQLGRRNVGLQKAMAQFWSDRAMFSLAVQMLPWDKMPSEFVKDRGQSRGIEIKPEAMMAQRPKTASKLGQHVQLIEEQLVDAGDGFFLGTPTPSYADCSARFLLKYLKANGAADEVLDPSLFPKTMAWLERLDPILDGPSATALQTLISGDVAAESLAARTHEAPLPFNEGDADLVGVRRGQRVDVCPDDYAKDPCTGELVGLTSEQVVIDVERPGDGKTRVAFPRLGYIIQASSA